MLRYPPLHMTASDDNESPQELVLSILADYLDVPVEELTPEKTLEELGADSLDYLQIAFDIEEKFGIELGGDGAELRQKIRTIEDVLRITAELVEQKNG